MSKKLSFTVELTFEDKIVDDNEIKEIGGKLLKAITQGIYDDGLTPENSGTFTKFIRVGNRDFTVECDILKEME